MKKNYFCFFLFVLFFLVFQFNLVRASGPLDGKVFVLDAGHGGVDPGSVVGDVYEKDINLAIVLKVKEKLMEKGAKVILTREGDYDLGTPKAVYRKKSDFDHRIHYINTSNANYYLSIHLNYLSDSSYSGVQVFYSSVDKKNEDIASSIQSFMNEKLGTDREIKRISNSIYMYSKLDVPGVLVECGFLSNGAERTKLLDEQYIQQFAQYLALSLVSI